MKKKSRPPLLSIRLAISLSISISPNPSLSSYSWGILVADCVPCYGIDLSKKCFAVLSFNSTYLQMLQCGHMDLIVRIPSYSFFTNLQPKNKQNKKTQTRHFQVSGVNRTLSPWETKSEPGCTVKQLLNLSLINLRFNQAKWESISKAAEVTVQSMNVLDSSSS